MHPVAASYLTLAGPIASPELARTAAFYSESSSSIAYEVSMIDVIVTLQIKPGMEAAA